MHEADLAGVILRHANLRGANLRSSVLNDANLTDAVLTDADLTDAVLRDAVLTDAVLRDANLTTRFCARRTEILGRDTPTGRVARLVNEHRSPQCREHCQNLPRPTGPEWD
ncbi:pentapeptide repeat-containing protein [Rhodococcus cerastii]|nr:pentapeptide repeat-containing protein [Rhodococcus cerastii]